MSTPSGSVTVPFTDQGQRFADDREAVLQLVSNALTEGPELDGPVVRRLEQRCAGMVGRRYARAVGSGTDALTLALRAARVGPADEVIVTNFSFVASAAPISVVGAIPVFVDIDPYSYLMDLDSVSSAITNRTRAIIAVGIFGRALPPKPFEDLASERGLTLIEDAAQALGAVRDGRLAGSLGQISAVSFDPLKVVGGITTGGMVLTDDPAIHERVRVLSSQGFNSCTGKFELLGCNSRMSTLNAAVLNYELDRYAQAFAQRRHAADTYLSGLAEHRYLRLPQCWAQHEIGNLHKFVIATEARGSLQRHLAKDGIETKIHYSTALSDLPIFCGSRSDAVHRSQIAARTVLSLPIHPQVSEQDLQYVVASINRWAP
jgi:dTDP-4-amino-4,6-dideoxygalactose transaminase